MRITNQMIIDCAKLNGFKLPDKPFTKWGMNYNPIDVDIIVSRPKTVAGNKDLGEWWVSYPGSISTFRVTDEDMKAYIRDININKIIK